MKRIMHLLPLLVVIVAIGIITKYVIEDRNRKKEQEAASAEAPPATAPVADTMAPQDQALVKQVFDDPKSLDEKKVELEQKLTKYADLSNRPPLMSQRNSDVEDLREPPIARTNTNRPAYLDAFASLRKDEIRNPDSKGNREAVASMMKKRAKRIKQLDRSKIEL